LPHVTDPSGCLEIDGPFRSVTPVAGCSLTIHGKRIEIVDGKSAGVKACQTPCRQRYYDCVNRYSSSKYANTFEFDRQTRKYSNTDYPVSDFSP
jgi:hypothetical protein